MKVKGFWHIYAVNHWYSVVIDQMRVLLTSGLYDECEEISIGLISLPDEKLFLEKYIVNNYPKLKIKSYSTNPTDYEFPTLRLIEEDRSSYVGFYFHSKGVTRPFETVVNHWRVFLNEHVLNQWREHRERVEGKYDASSVNYLKAPDHFSGNFWWFNRSYIDRLPPLEVLDHSNRYHAEQWICMGHGKLYYPEFREPGETSFTFKYKLL